MVDDEVSARRVDVLLAEYGALRQEILSRSSTQHMLINLDLTLAGLVAGLAFSQKVSLLILLLIPILSACCSLLYFDHAKQISVIGEHIGGWLAPQLDDVLGAQLLGWDRRASPEQHGFGPVFVFIVPTFVLFVVNPVALTVSLLWSTELHRTGWAWSAWTLGAVLNLIVVGAWFTLIRRWRRWSKNVVSTP